MCGSQYSHLSEEETGLRGVRELAQVGNRAGADLALEPTLPRCEVNIYVR